MLKDKVTGQPRGCAFVSYATREEADAAIQHLDRRVQLPGALNKLEVRTWASWSGLACRSYIMTLCIRACMHRCNMWNRPRAAALQARSAAGACTAAACCWGVMPPADMVHRRHAAKCMCDYVYFSRVACRSGHMQYIQGPCFPAGGACSRCSLLQCTNEAATAARTVHAACRVHADQGSLWQLHKLRWL